MNIASHFFASVYGTLEVFLEAIKFNDGLQILPTDHEESLVLEVSGHLID